MSEVSIANRALQLLGADSIISLADDTNRARAMAIAYEPVRDAELTRHRWRFTLARDQLPALSTAPLFEYPYQYQAPNDMLRLIEGGDLQSGPDLSDYRAGMSRLYSVEGDKILTHIPAPLSICYIARITDTSLFAADFSEALSARLADELCERLTQSDSKRQICMEAYKRAIREAKRSNAIQVATQSAADEEWIMGRTQ
jgi:hypothetical protein